MVGMVIVCHSRRLAEGVKELAQQVTQGKVPIEVAAGIDDPVNPIGTDPMKVLAAIKTVQAAAADGVLVLMDLGSALMSAETALELLPEDARSRVRLCAAPVVEGAISAAVQASVGASLDAVAAEALAALAAKEQQLAPLAGQPVVAATFVGEETADNIAETRLIIRNRIGLHARPAANLVTTAGKFRSVITVCKGAKSVSAKSINQLARLAIRKDDEIRVQAVGPDAQEAIAAIEALSSGNFGEKETEISEGPTFTVSETVATEGGLIYGVPASAGVAIGPTYLFKPLLPKIQPRHTENSEFEITRLAAALAKARKEIGALAAKTNRVAGAGEATIFDFHRLILEDPDLVAQAEETIRKEQVQAEAAWLQVMETTVKAYRSLDNAYMQARAADVIDAGSRVLRQLAGESVSALVLEAPALIAAHDLLPSDVAQLDPQKVLGLVTVLGGSTSHAAILARSMGIPAVVGAGPAVTAIAPGAVIAIDGDSGRIWLCPDEAVRGELERRRTEWLGKRCQALQEAHKPAVTTDGIAIHVTANIGMPPEVRPAFDHGAEGVGLFRTEFLFQQRAAAPTEDEQYVAYLAAAKAMQGRPVIIRTLDVGGDKPLVFRPVPTESNPFLGERGIRFCLTHTDVFKPQLRALLRAIQEANIKIMFPMVAHLAELRAARALLEEARKELAQKGISCDRSVESGIMIEVPAAVAMADRLAKEAHFFSIGTNDLTQYVMAADRGNPAVAQFCDSFHPAVLRMVRATVEAGHKAGIPVGMCGELAGMPAAAPLLVGLGLDELSMNARSVPEVKAAIRKLSAAGCRLLAKNALDQDDGIGVRQLLSDVNRNWSSR
jgi:multiphosphoryl transfer protein